MTAAEAPTIAAAAVMPVAEAVEAGVVLTINATTGSLTVTARVNFRYQQQHRSMGNL